jgi:hypothetical protein
VKKTWIYILVLTFFLPFTERLLEIFEFRHAPTRLEAKETTNTADPPFGDTAGTIFDIIQATDPSLFTCMEYAGRGMRQIWDKRINGEPVVNAFLFIARYSDGTNTEIAINPEFSTKEYAGEEAKRYVKALGQLPTSLRKGIKRFSVHKGRKGFHAGTGQIVVYAETADNRFSYKHLEESLFHEAVHASWDDDHRLSTGWINAQKMDNRFLTKYGQNSPEREDLAETALFAYAISHHPDRLPPVDTADTLNAVPQRIEYIKKILPPGVSIFYPVMKAKKCSGDTL